MAMFEFSIVASGLNHEAEDFEARFYNGGCDDSLVAFQKCHIIIDFAREAETVDEAIASAIEAVTALGAVVERVEPDPLVNLSDIAERSDLTRAAVSLYNKGQRGKDFPAPVARVTSDSPLWDWSAVAQWLFANGKLPLASLEMAVAVKEANEAIAHGDLHMLPRLKQRVGELHLR